LKGSSLINDLTPENRDDTLDHTIVTKLEKVNSTNKFVDNKQVQDQLHQGEN